MEVSSGWDAKILGGAVRRRTLMRRGKEPPMADTKTFPYETRLDIKFKPLELIDVGKEVGTVTHPWFNQTLCKVNDSVVRLGVVKGEYHWHKHDDEDEFFYCVEGRSSSSSRGGRSRSSRARASWSPRASCTSPARRRRR
jgi:hypothetical protein